MYANLIYAFFNVLINATRVRYGRSEFHTLESTVRGRHVYKAVWNPVVGHVLHIQSEDSNTYDRFAVATHLRASSFQSVASPEHLDSDIGFVVAYLCL